MHTHAFSHTPGHTREELVQHLPLRSITTPTQVQEDKQSRRDHVTQSEGSKPTPDLVLLLPLHDGRRSTLSNQSVKSGHSLD